MTETISKSQFKPQALKYFRKIQKDGQPLIITDHGKPVLKISSYQERPQAILEELRNSVKQFDAPLDPVAIDDWEILK